MAIINKEGFSLEGLNPIIKENLSKVSKDRSVFARGVGGHPLIESVPQVIKTSTEKYYENGNAYIVFGKDRPASRLSGYGGKGHTGAFSIDIVVGRLGYKAREFDGDKRLWVDPSFKDDAARIYISQKTDVDENFGLVSGRVGISTAKSAVAIKADGVRIIAREGIKLITKTDAINSQGGSVDSTPGIDLIAGNDDSTLQPIPKGRNLNEALKAIVFQLDKLNGIVDSLLMYQMSLNTQLTHHIHLSPFFGLPTSPSPTVVPAGIKTMVDHLLQTKMSLTMQKANVALLKHRFFNPSGKDYINSRRNNTN